MTTYLDSATDLQGQWWYVNDRVRHTIPGVRSDAGRIVEIPARVVVRVVVAFDDGGRAPCYCSELTLIRRRTADEVPYAALEG